MTAKEILEIPFGQKQTHRYQTINLELYHTNYVQIKMTRLLVLLNLYISTFIVLVHQVLNIQHRKSNSVMD
jgi:hypothetical protein